MSSETPNDPYGPPSGGGASPPPPPPPPPPPGGPGTPPPYQGAGGFQPAAPRYSVADAFNYGWKKFQESWTSWVLATLIFGAVMLVLNFLYNMVLGGMFTTSTSYTYDSTTGAYVYSTGGIPGGFIVSMVLYEIVAVVLSWIFQAQFVRAGLENTKAGRISLDIFFKTALLGAVVLGALVVSALTLVGFILCIVPGLVFGFFAQFFQYFILDQGQSPLTAIKSSLSFVSGNLANVFLLSIASIVAVIIGALLCGVGLLIAIPVVVLAQAYTYRVLSGQPVAA